MIDFDKEAEPPAEQRFRIWARRLQLWRFCANGACARARSCRGNLRRCCLRFADWSEAVRDEARRERYANDPVHKAMRDELAVMLERLARSMTSEAPQGS